VAGLIGVLRDITEIKQAQSEHSRQVVETASDAFVATDQEGTITQWNHQAEALLGWSPREAIGLPVIETIVPPRQRTARRRELERYAANKAGTAKRRSVEVSVLHRDGHEIPVELSLWPVVVNGAQHFNAFLRDNRERLRQEALRKKNQELEEESRRAAEASKLKSQFVANMSHELRTPLNAIIGFSQLLADGKAGATSTVQGQMIGDILTSSRHLLDLINAVLDLAKVESGKMEFRPARLVVQDLVGEVCEVVRSLAAKKRVRLTSHVHPDLREITADPTRLRQVLYNYLTNAVKFTPEDGQVTLLITPEGDTQFRLSVEDTGIGIRPEDQARLFVEFQQLDQGTGKQFQGTGLGLSLTKQIVEAQGGVVGLTSALGAGSTFFAVLPRQSLEDEIGEANK
jgi:PAS domain S-box-containing protein